MEGLFIPLIGVKLPLVEPWHRATLANSNSGSGIRELAQDSISRTPWASPFVSSKPGVSWGERLLVPIARNDAIYGWELQR